MSDDNDKYSDKIQALIVKYFASFDSCSWPEPGGEGWDDIVRIWVSAFGEHRYSPIRVKKAMDKIHQNPPQWKQDHLPALLKILAADGNVGPQGPQPEKEVCELCDGCGWATIFRSDYRGVECMTIRNPIHQTSRRVYLRITAPCTCNAGRRAHASCLLTRVKVIDLVAIPKGWSFDEPDWTREDSEKSA